MFGENLKKLRIKKNLSQEELGLQFNVTKGTISGWENGRTEPPYEILVEIANYFGVTLDYLFGLNQDDVNTLNRLRTALKEAGMWDDNIDDMKLEDFEKSIKIMNMLNHNKDTDK